MRKLRFSEKRKWVVNGLLAFGAVSLLTTGFATWIVGVNQRNANGNVSVSVDTAQKNNINFTFEILEEDNDIWVGEKNTTEDDDGDYITITGNGEKETDFNVGIKLTLQVGKDVSEKPTSINIDLNYEGTGLNLEEVDNSAATGNKVTVSESTKTHDVGEYKYIDIADEFKTLTLPTSVDEAKSGWTYQDNDGDITYTYTNNTAKLFKWGNFFGIDSSEPVYIASPSNYYNKLFANNKLTNSIEDVDFVYNEFLAMKQVFMYGPKTEHNATDSWVPKTLNLLASLE